MSKIESPRNHDKTLRIDDVSLKVDRPVRSEKKRKPKWLSRVAWANRSRMRIVRADLG